MLKLSALLATAIFVLCDSTIIQKDKRCKVKDEECLKSLYENLVKEVHYGNSDSFIIKDFNVPLLGMLNVTLTEGAVKGLKSCYCTGFKNNVEAGLAKIEIMCDHVGFEEVFITEFTPTLSALTGGIEAQGKGTGSYVLEKLKVNVDIAFEVKKLDDSEVYFNLKREESSITFEILGKPTIVSKKYYVGEQDISKIVIDVINDNWNFFINTFGQLFFDNVSFKYFDQLLKIHPAKEFIIDDLTYLVKI